ncbi:MAG: ribosome biogenesis/translation initiation ATPase RLI [Nanobdellota archaeon]
MTRIAVVDNEKLTDPSLKKHLINICPVNKKGDPCIYLENGKLQIDEMLCIGCGICHNAAPDAISIVNLPEDLDKPPVHRYGRNGFHLYGLPIPIFGKVTGIIGKNGIGKSTAINILSGILKPNLGEDNTDDYMNKLIEYFKGTEAQYYFEKLRDGKIKVSYKLQQVDQIPKAFKGSVKEFLSKVSDDEKRIKDLSEELSFDNILDSNIGVISGGELQRVAIAATVLKDANVYFFDEPTSFLDIKQRLKVSEFIKNLAGKKNSKGEEIAVVVIEHDLIILDYITDLIHLIYGQENTYGIVSLPKASKRGINRYLDGYLQQENIRFRDYRIKFPEKVVNVKKEDELLVSWENLEKDFGRFNLTSGEGKIYRKDIVGVLGENGIGKTTFMKILADEIKVDKGNIEENINISYKPQYIETDSDELVMNYLKEALSKYKNNLIKPLGIESILLKPLNELSGGQMQRVSIAYTLSQDADLFLLDEPSAYLDIEQRLVISKIIRDLMELRGKTAVIIDHDLLFLDYISDKMLVFEGKPAMEGKAKGPFSLQEGMNDFLKEIKLTFRRDEETNRPKANKRNSQMDQKQISENKYYYI